MLGDVRAFSFKNVGMRVMCIVMCNAGALADDDTPPWPAWPAGVAFEHEQLLEDALDDPTREASLSREDRKLVWSKRTAIEARRRVRSRSSQKVPGFKFESNDGWIVEQDECRWIAEKLRAFAATFDAVCVADVERARGEQRRAAIEEMNVSVFRPSESRPTWNRSTCRSTSGRNGSSTSRASTLKRPVPVIAWSRRGGAHSRVTGACRFAAARRAAGA